MIDRQGLDKLQRRRDVLPNILAPELERHGGGERWMSIAEWPIRLVAQNLIDDIEDHVHLREATILIVTEAKPLGAADRMVSLAKASKASGLVAFLAAGADFVIRITAATWPRFDWRQQTALLDHQLTHCGVTIAGKYLVEKRVSDFVEELGKDLVEVDDDYRDEQGRVLVRYRKRTEDGKYAWRIRKHEVETFTSIVTRWGGWSPPLREVIDELEKDDPQLRIAWDAPNASRKVETPEAATADDTRVTLESGGERVETTVAGIEEAAKAIASPDKADTRRPALVAAPTAEPPWATPAAKARKAKKAKAPRRGKAAKRAPKARKKATA